MNSVYTFMWIASGRGGQPVFAAAGQRGEKKAARVESPGKDSFTEAEFHAVLSRSHAVYRDARTWIDQMLEDSRLGKMQIADEVLNKPGRLTEEEFTIIKAHPAWASR